jgi:hypothetical protein
MVANEPCLGNPPTMIANNMADGLNQNKHFPSRFSSTFANTSFLGILRSTKLESDSDPSSTEG